MGAWGFGPGMTHDILRMGLIVEEADAAREVIGEAVAAVFRASA
jgi:hypothetical protein